ncbi:MAG: tetratricopeptide repeat protein [Pseudomonadota bacterium]
MSLLLKALKQAESGDRAGAAGRRDPDLELEPVASTGSAQAREWVEPPGLLFGSSGLTPAAQPAAGFRWPQLSLVPAVALFAVLIALGYGVYLYFALQPPEAALSPLPTAAPMPAAQPAGAPAPQPAPPRPAPLAIDSAAAVADPAMPSSPPQPAVRSATPASPSPRAASVPRETAPAPAVPTFQPDVQSGLLAHAYAAYQRGALDEAQRLYAQAAAGSRSVDALLGLAAIASLRGSDADAQRLYRQALELDPHNAVAQGALLDLLGNTDSLATESRLKMLIEREPSPHLYQTLGNLYADQQRWSEAQGAYFEASRGAPDNADYAFNLAVSLDQLREYAAALAYYEKALAAGGAHRFDRARAEARVQQLKALR